MYSVHGACHLFNYVYNYIYKSFLVMQVNVLVLEQSVGYRARYTIISQIETHKLQTNCFMFTVIISVRN